jgi:hypothetical protein
MVRGSLIDDSYITLSYARTLAVHLHWGMIPQEVANSATSPLNVLLLAAATTLLRVSGGVHPVAALGVVFAGCLVMTAWGWSRIVRALRSPWWVAVAGTAAVAVNPFVLSATGLEVHLIAAVLTVLVAMALEGRPVWFGVVGGLAMISRLDLVIFVVLIALCTTSIRHRLGTAALIALLVSAPWYVFSWLVLGSAIPDTFVLKTLQHSFSGWTYFQGPLFYLAYKDALGTLVSFAPAVAGLVALLAWSAMRLTGGGAHVRRLAPMAALGFGGAA